jgi:hypothetical protein
MSKNWFSGGYILRAAWRFRKQLPDTVEPLIRMNFGADNVTVAAGEKNPKGDFRAVMAPLFLIYPGALDPQRTLLSLSHPVLDKNTGQVLVTLLKALGDSKSIAPLHK